MTAIVMSPFPPPFIYFHQLGLTVLSIYNSRTMVESTANLVTKTCALAGWVSGNTPASLHSV